jgi:hypothetical protein
VNPAESRAAASRRADRLAWLGAAVLFVALALFGQRYHWVEEAGTAERDGYVAQAETLLSGRLPHDPFRPLLYPLLAAALTPLTGDAFTAARLLSNLAAAALAWLAYACGRQLAGAAAGGWAMALLAVNPNLWIIGQHTTTDMLFAALGAGCLLAALRYLDAPAAAPAAAAGLALGLAAFTRGNAFFLLPALALAWWLAGPRAAAAASGGGVSAVAPTLGAAPREPAPAAAAQPSQPAGALPGAGSSRWSRLPHLALAAAVTLLALAPHWLLRHAEFGNPFYDENWKNLAFKLHGYPDWSYLERVPFRSLGEVIRSGPAAVVSGGLAELLRFGQAGAAQLFGTGAHVLLIVAGTLWALATPATRRGAAWLVLALASFLAATAFSFFTWGRLLLLLLPGAYALTFAPWGGGAAWRRWGPRGRTALALAPAALVLLLAGKTFAFRLPAFVANHPYVEVALLRRLDARLPPGAALGGTSPALGRYLHRRYVALPDAFGLEMPHPELYYARLAELVRRERVAFLVVGRIDLRSRPAGLLAPNAPVAWLAPAGGDRGVVIWEVVQPRRPAVSTNRQGAGGMGRGSGSGNLDDVLRLQALRPLDHLEGDSVPFVQSAESLGDDRGVMDENVRAPLPHDEPIPLGVVEPLHGSLLGHTLAP